ncbi:tryptophan synthase beta subunit-like PLP-dependent enzyme [Parathielavia appendiculata]|uniref:L-serine ammonia-lyase n=1 Tax=Parathielavia appendiculata TaxID=2587402 RepID=A0AAN6Z767_9PEZI|nr:tryptophan synthase beta subunit-like PLP-dependent enzyme [Parathielavia appendiculata]
MGSFSPEPPKPWVETPLIFSPPISRAAGCNIYLKLENTQPSGSFKSRGVGNMMLRAISTSDQPEGSKFHFYCSSGGNAGLACATTAIISLRQPATIVVPTSTSAFMIAKLRELGADVVQMGASWAEADAFLRETLLLPEEGLTKVYVPPFDHPDVWAGVSTMVDEIALDMGVGMGGRFEGVGGLDGIVCNVGGGGLLNGVMEGLARNAKRLGGRDGTKVLAVETVGAESLYASVLAGELVTLPAITSIATSLGARRVSQKTWEWAQTAGADKLISATVTDQEAAMACVRFLDDARILIEVACGATVATAYNGDLRRYLGKGLTDEEWARRNVVLVVCGGSNISWEILEKYKETYGRE